jgi:hypothetical protein
MKNLFLLPTDKPSRLIIHSTLLNEFRLLDKPIEDWKHKKNIYITNDEEIKLGEWVIYTKGIKIHCKKIDSKEDVELANIENSGVLKIILTTDQELILDGVQDIKDEFLELFVKNPSCEEVEVEWVDFSQSYFIKITKEEAKQGTMSEAIKQVISNQLKQEKLEEAKKYLSNEGYGKGSNFTLNCVANLMIEWQQEQDNNKYSEEDMLNFAWYLVKNLGQYSCDRTAHFKSKYLEQFKKINKR